MNCNTYLVIIKSHCFTPT